MVFFVFHSLPKNDSPNMHASLRSLSRKPESYRIQTITFDDPSYSRIKEKEKYKDFIALSCPSYIFLVLLSLFFFFFFFLPFAHLFCHIHRKKHTNFVCDFYLRWKTTERKKMIRQKNWKIGRRKEIIFVP